MNRSLAASRPYPIKERGFDNASALRLQSHGLLIMISTGGNKMNGAQALVATLIQYDTRVVFGLPGDTSIDWYDALRDHASQIRHIVARDERGAAFMADVFARLTGKPGICEGPSGGGATYMLPGVVEAHQSSVALIALTTDNPLSYEAEGALTDLDQSALYQSVTKWAALVKNAGDLPRFLRRAFRIATSGRPGAVHLALPKDVLAQQVGSDVAVYAEDACKAWPSYRTRPPSDGIRRMARALLSAQRPVIIAGGGVLSSGAASELLAVAGLLNAPVATTINGKGSIAETHLLSLGVVGGNGGSRWANQIVQEADAVLFIGSKVNYVDTDNWLVPSKSQRPTVLQIDVDPSVIGNTYPIDEGLCGDAKLALADLFAELGQTCHAPIARPEWLDDIAQQKMAHKRLVQDKASSSQQPIMPQRVIAELGQALGRETVFVCDPGTATPFMAEQFQTCEAGRSMVFPRAQGGLGYAIPGVVGARLARPEATIVGLCGDGSFAMSASDLPSVARVGGPTILILFNNHSYGWIKALQRIHHEERYFSVDLAEPIDYVQVAEGFGWRGTKVTDPDEIGAALKRALDYGGPFLIELETAGEHTLIPPVAGWQRWEESRSRG